MSDRDNADDILAAIRRLVRAIDINSRKLVRDYGVTGPQLLALGAIARLGPVTVTALAREISLSQPTVTGILARLEHQGLIRRERGTRDRRAVTSTITTSGLAVLRDTPVPLEDRFRRELARLDDWEQTQTLATLQRIAAMMEADDLEAAPILSTEVLPDPDTRNISDEQHHPESHTTTGPSPGAIAADNQPKRPR